MEEFKIFDSIMTYSIDLSYDEKYCEPCKLNEDIFFDELYLRRVKKEEEIKHLLKNSTKPLLIHGFPGTGKTTIVSKLLREEDEKIIIKFDFKGKDQIDKIIDFEEWFSRKLRQKLNVILESKSISVTDIILFLFSTESLSYELPFELSEIRQKIYNHYKIKNPKMEINFDKWLDKQKEYFDKFVYGIITEQSFDKLRNRDIFYYFSKKLKHSIFLFCDNMDSIIKHETRQSFYSHIRSYSGIISMYVNIIVTARYSTISSHSHSDYGSYSWEKISLDYKEFIDEEKLEKFKNKIIREKGFCNPLDLEHEKDEIERDIKEQFSKKFIKTRCDYYKKVIKSKNSLIKDNQYEKLLELIISNKHIHVALLELANHDRRFKLRYIIEFIRYIIFELRINIYELGVNDKERSFIIESYFYHWIVINKRINIDRYNSIEEILQSTDNLDCSLSNLIITLIYNLTKKERGAYNYSYTITVGEVVEKLESIGYSKNKVLEKILMLYKHGDDHVGLIEMSRFFEISNYGNIEISDHIWITPRSIYLCEFLNSKYVFMLALYRKNKLKLDNQNQFFDYDDVNPITRLNIYHNLIFLKNIAIKHIKSLQLIKRNLDRDDWLEYYQKLFSLYQKYERDGYKKRFQVEFILISHIKFFKRMKTYSRYDFITNNMVNQYENLLTFYSNNVEKLVRSEKIEMDFEIKKNYFE